MLIIDAIDEYLTERNPNYPTKPMYGIPLVCWLESGVAVTV